MGLFATLPIDEVTVQDIAGSVDVTPAAVYYHFASKEQILLEGMRRFGDELIDEAKLHLSAVRNDATLRTTIAHLIGWVGARPQPATVFFVNSLGLNQAVEALRREVHAELIELLRPVLTGATASADDVGAGDTAGAGVTAVAVVSLLMVSIASMLNHDAAYRALGARRFGDHVASLAADVAGFASLE